MEYNSNHSIEHSTSHEHKLDRVKELLRIVQGDNENPPQGRPFAHQYETVGFKIPKHVTQLEIRAQQEWEGMMGHGLTWAHLRDFVTKRGCVQIGSLYLSRSLLHTSTFQTLFQSVHYNDEMFVAIIRHDEPQQHHLQEEPKGCTRKEDEATLRGLIRLRTTTAATELECHFGTCQLDSCESGLLSLWPFSCDWGMILGCIHIVCRLEPPFCAWISRHFREVVWSGNDGLTKASLHHLLVNTESTVDCLHCPCVSRNVVELLSDALRQSSTLKSFRTDSLGSAQLFGILVQGFAECTTLRTVSLAGTCCLSPQIWTDKLASLIGCGHLEDIEYRFYHDGIEPRIGEGGEDDELDSVKVFHRTQKVIDAIGRNPGLVKLFVHYGANRCVNLMKIYSVVDLKRSRLVVSRMSRLLEGGCGCGCEYPLNSALFGKMVCLLVLEVVGCESEYDCEYGDCHGVKRSIGVLFDLICATSNHVIQQFNHSRGHDDIRIDVRSTKQTLPYEIPVEANQSMEFTV